MELDVEVHQRTSSLTLHQKGLEFKRCAVSNDKAHMRIVECSGWDVDEINQKVQFHFSESISPGPARFHLAWQVDLSKIRPPVRGEKGWSGLYVLHEGPDQYHHITQFEPCNARQCYPCFDQPCTKMTFRLTLSNIPQGLTALSNTEVQTEKVEDIVAGNNQSPRKTVTFHKTRPIATYLTAWVVGTFKTTSKELVLPNFELENANAQRSVQIRVHIPPSFGDGEYAMLLACKSVEFFTRSFHVDYPYAKMDNVATPLHPLLGMENWGLITYLSGYLDTGPSTNTDRRKRIARLVGHEVVHQWFGNSTSVAWWSFLYLKEGFARLLEYVFVDDLFPEWQYWNHFLSDIRQQVLEMDEKRDTHPIERRIDHPPEIFKNVDTICYAKGACVLRQLWSYLGKESFFKALQIYLKRHKDECATPNLLWQALTEACNNTVDVSYLMESWVKWPGHPIVRARRDPSTGIMYLEQLLCEEQDGDLEHLGVPRDEDHRTRFVIPIVARIKGVTHKFLMTQGVMRVDLAGTHSDFVLLNKDACGFYRVHYGEDLLASLIAENGSDLQECELFNILDDTLFFFLERGGSGISATVLVNLITLTLSCVKSHYLWQVLIPRLSQLMTALEMTSAYGHVATALRPYVNAFYEFVKTPDGAEFIERGQLKYLELLLTQVCSALDPWSLQLQSAAEDSLFQMSQPTPVTDPRTLTAILHPLMLWTRQPITCESACDAVLRVARDAENPDWGKEFLMDILWKGRSDRILRVLLTNVNLQNYARLLRAVNTRFLAQAMSDECNKKVLANDVSRDQVREILTLADGILSDPATHEVREVFQGFSYRSPSKRSYGDLLKRDRSSSLGPKHSPRGAGSTAGDTNNNKNYVPWHKYVVFGAVMVGAAVIGLGAYRLISQQKQT